MLDKKIVFALGALLCGAVLAAWWRGNFSPRAQAGEAAVIIDEHEYSVELAQTPMAQAQGLSGREFLSADHGMLFVFTEAASRSFWMKGMRFPIDIVWIRAEKVIGVTENVPLPQGFSMPIITSPEPADRVLELPAGTAARNSITIGSVVKMKP